MDSNPYFKLNTLAFSQYFLSCDNSIDIFRNLDNLVDIFRHLNNLVNYQLKQFQQSVLKVDT